jgi:hypothetical protein
MCYTVRIAKGRAARLEVLLFLGDENGTNIREYVPNEQRGVRTFLAAQQLCDSVSTQQKTLSRRRSLTCISCGAICQIQVEQIWLDTGQRNQDTVAREHGFRMKCKEGFVGEHS